VRRVVLLFPAMLAQACHCGDRPALDDTSPPEDSGPQDDSTVPGETAPPCDNALTVDELQPGDLVITELMLRPLTDDGRWLEFANTSGCPVNLDSLVIDVDDSALRMGGAEDFEPGAHITVATSHQATDNGGFDPDWATGALDLDHSHATVTLLADDRALDSVSFSNGVWFSDDYAGASHALTEEATDIHSNDAVASWCLSRPFYGDGTHRGTPGEPNGACVGTIWDADGDGWQRAEAGGADCDDDDPTTHPGADEVCDDGDDNNCDGDIDCLDDGCGPSDGCEDCGNGSDDDGDGLVDCEDGDCANSFPCYEDCFNGSDDDLDGLVDCADDDCWGGTCHPGGVKAHVTAGSFRRQRQSRQSYGERLYHGAICRYFDGQRTTSITTLENIQGTVQVLPAGASAWDTTSARSTCTWSVRLAHISEEKVKGYRGIYWDHEFDRSDVNIGSGCRLYEPWFLPDRLFRYGHNVYAGYAFTWAGMPFYATSPWYAIERSEFTRTSSNHWVTSTICDSDYHRYSTATSSGNLGSSFEPLLVVP
jgi:hypothetical protein